MTTDPAPLPSHDHITTAIDAAIAAETTRAKAAEAALDARLKALEAPVPVPVPVPVPPPPVPVPAPSAHLTALVMGEWLAVADAKGCVNAVTVAEKKDSASAQAHAKAYLAAGMKVVYILTGEPYTKLGIRSLVAADWIARAIAALKANPGITAIEPFNEPGGFWYWGVPTLADAINYITVLKGIRAGIKANGLTTKLIASFDGGSSGNHVWWDLMKAADPNIASYLDGVTVHPYGGNSAAARATSALGNRAGVKLAHDTSGLPVWITELGWPTAVGQPATGDSLQWTEAEQAANITSFVTWAKAQGYVAATSVFMFEGYSTNMWYGVVREPGNPAGPEGSHKPSYLALAALR